MKRRFLLLLPLLTLVATAQTQSGINAPVSRTVTLAADEAAFAITITATLDSTEQQVKQALQSAGLPNPTVVATGLAPGVSQWFSGPVQMLYSATVTIAAGAAGDAAMTAAKSLETLRTHLPDPLQGLQYSVTFNPSQATVDAQRLVVLPQLLGDARKLAQSLAAATGVGVGAIRSISDSAGLYMFAYFAPTAAERSGDFLLGNISSLPPSSMQYTFSLTVVFATVP
jgi:hypothetical protein